LSLEFIENQPKQNIYLHSITIGQGVDTSLVNTQKIFLALNFITSNLTSKYSIIPEKEVKDVIGNERDVSALHIGARLGADYVFIIKMEQLWNAVRIEIISARPKGVSDNIHTSDGVSMLSIFDKSTELPIMDPAILKSMQRAFACAVNDSAMFMHLPTPYNVKPAPGLVICGIEFLDNEELQHWSLFDNPILSSYEFIEMIYETILNTTD
jgi:type IV secretory pathway VirB9-like protein